MTATAASPQLVRAGAGTQRDDRQHRRRRRLGLPALLILLACTVVASIAVGTKSIPFTVVLDALTAYRPEVNDHLVIREIRLPRTAVGLLAGTALGLAGAVMQGVARNPLADPGILGVNAGAALFVVLGIYVFGLTNLLGYVWFGFAGAALAAFVVHVLGSRGRGGATPTKLAVAGAATTALLGSVTTAILLVDAATLDAYRFWAVGSLSGRTSAIAWQMTPFIVVGTVLALSLARLLNALALGDDVARALGQRVALARLTSAGAVVLLTGAATAAVGPIAFIGLTVPHVARAIAGPDYRRVLPYSALLAPILLLGADILGRVVARPAELQVGLVTALVGGPFFVALVRRHRPGHL